MQIQVIWKNGALYPVHPLHLKYKTTTVEIADDDLEGQGASYHIPEDVLQEVNRMQGRFAAIRNASLSPDGKLTELTTKQLERIEASAWRDEIRKERGHTA